LILSAGQASAAPVPWSLMAQPTLACRTLTSNFPDGEIKLLPLPGFELIGDLSVDTGKFMRAMSERVESWIHDQHADNVNYDKLEERMDPDVAEEIYELERCVECGACVSACATKRMRPGFSVCCRLYAPGPVCP
jgi:fumarate reductase iron-sulfur subunit